MEEDFGYKSLPGRIAMPGFYTVKEEEFFWVLRKQSPSRVEESEKTVVSSERNVGWKIHISLAESPDNIQKAWDCIIDLLKAYGINTCKVLIEGKHLPAFQWGKEITLYYQLDLASWNDLLNDMTKRFLQAGVCPGYLAFNDKCVEGSSFFGFRNDEGEKGEYASSLFTKDFNPSNKLLPEDWTTLKVIEPHQPLRPLREHEKELKEFYKKIMIGVRSCSINFMELLKPFSLTVSDLGKKFPIWTIEELEIDTILTEFHEEAREMILDMINEIKQIQKIENQDFFLCTQKELAYLNEHYEGRLKYFERTLKAVTEQCEDIKKSESACFDSRNVSPAKSSSSEGSPREDGGQGGLTVVEPPSK